MGEGIFDLLVSLIEGQKLYHLIITFKGLSGALLYTCALDVSTHSLTCIPLTLP